MDCLGQGMVMSFFSTDQCLLNSKVLSCFSVVIMSIRSFFYLGMNWLCIKN